MPDTYGLIINEAIEEINSSLAPELKITVSQDTPLMGHESKLDSLLLVRLLITIERISEERYGNVISIIDETAFEDGGTPFSTIGSLQKYLNNRFA